LNHALPLTLLFEVVVVCKITRNAISTRVVHSVIVEFCR
jgi:hypothetical protein